MWSSCPRRGVCAQVDDEGREELGKRGRRGEKRREETEKSGEKREKGSEEEEGEGEKAGMEIIFF